MFDQNWPYPDGKGNYSTNFFTDRAKAIIQNHGKTGVPMFMWLSYTAPHAPLQVCDIKSSRLHAYSVTEAERPLTLVCFIERITQDYSPFIKHCSTNMAEKPNEN